jgi:26S proteasome regulatory subunit N6
VHSIVTGKLAIKYRGCDIDAMKAVAAAAQNRSLKEFEKALNSYKAGKFEFLLKLELISM